MLKVGLIGCGFMGSMHANCYNNIANAKVTAVADLRPEKAQELAAISGAEIYTTGKELIEKADVDVIDICLPTYLHAEHAILAMQKVKYVFVEKPVALTKEEGVQMMEAAAKYGANVQVGQVIRFWDEYVELAKMVESGVYGKIVNANFRRLSPVPTWGWDNWLLTIAKSGGAGQPLRASALCLTALRVKTAGDIEVVRLLPHDKPFFSRNAPKIINTTMNLEQVLTGVDKIPSLL